MKTVEAVYECGVFRPLEPVSLSEGSRVTVALTPNGPGQLPPELLAHGFMQYCQQFAGKSKSIEEVRQLLAAGGPLSETVIQQRKERFE